MDTQAQERFAEIKREIIKISESYTIIRQNRQTNRTLEQIQDEDFDNDKGSPLYEQRHIQLLQMRLNDLVIELNSMTTTGEIQIPLLYKDVVNKLRRSLLDNCPKEFVKVANDVEHLNVYLL